MVVVGVDQSGLLLMIATVLGSPMVVMCTAMVEGMPGPVVLVAIPRLRGWLIQVRLAMVVIHFAAPVSGLEINTSP
jgi:hypothetical protein